MRLKEFVTEKDFWEYVTHEVFYDQEKYRDGFRLALSGGSSAKIVTALNEKKYNWYKGTLWQVDERYVPVDDERSNQKHLKEMLGKKGDLLHVFDVKRPIAMCADDYDAMLKEDNEGWLFDLMILGVGSDGHIASIFPEKSGEMGRLSTRRFVQQSETWVHDGKERVGLGWRAIKKARRILVLLQGKSKDKIWKEAKSLDFSDSPFGRLLKEKDNVTVVYFH